MELQHKREFMKTCEILSCSADKLKEDLAKYRLEVMVGTKMLSKQRELMITTAYRTAYNIISKCDMLIKSVGQEHFEKLECYNQLVGFIAVYNKTSNKSTEAVLSYDKSVQTDTSVSGAVCEYITPENAIDETENCEVTVTVKEEMCGYDSDATIPVNVDTDLNDVMEDANVSHIENNGEDLYLRVPTPTQSYSSCSTEDGSYIFNLQFDDQSTSKDEHSKNTADIGKSESTIPFAHPNSSVVSTMNEKATPTEARTGDNCEEASIKSESIFEKSTQLNDSDAEIIDTQANLQDVEDEIAKLARISPQPRNENSNSPRLQLRIEHESDFEEDDDYYHLKNDDMRDSDLKSSSSSESEPEETLEFDSNKSDVFSEKDDSEEFSQETPTPAKKFADAKLRQLVVNVKRLPQEVMDRLLSSETNTLSDSECVNTKIEEDSSEDTLARLTKEIERLTDLSTLKCRKKRNKKYKAPRNTKKRKVENGDVAEEQSKEESTTSDSSSESCTSETRFSVGSPLQKPPAFEDLQYEILKNLSGDSEVESDDSEVYSESSSECEAKSTKSHQERKEEQKGNSKDKGCSTTTRKKVAEWRKDSLLRGKLISESSSSDSDIPKVSSARRKRRVISSDPDERLPVEDVVKQENAIKEESKDDTEDTRTAFTNSAPLYEVTDILSQSPESNSDVEFVCPSNQKKNDLYINNDDEHKSDDDVEFVEDDVGKPGRKNIRKVLDDVNLEEETKKANKEEEAQRHRLLKKKKELESWSQTSGSCQVQGLVLDLDDTTKQAIITVDSVLTARLKEHQIEGVRFMWDICYESVERLKDSPGTGCILAHCMGLGKTYQVIVLIHTLFKYPVTNTNHVLVVCPLSTVLNWVNEFEWGLKNAKEKVNVFYLRKQNSEKIKVLNRWKKKKGVLIMGYEAYERLVRSDTKEIIEALIDPGPDLIVCDEGHLIKNEKAIRSQALNRVKTRRRIMLTGTPIQNNLKEYYYMVNFVKPNLLGTYREYCNRFVNPITNGQYHDSTQHDIKIMKKRSHVLHKLLRSTVQRFEVSELEKQIPKKLDYVIFIKSHPLQASLYKQYIENIRIGEMTRILCHYCRLQAILSHPLVLDLKEKNDAPSKKNEQKEMEVIDLEPEIKENEPLPSGWWRNFCPEDYKDNLNYGPKFKVMFRIIDECEKIGDKLLIFSNSMAEMDAIEYNLKKRTIENRNWKKGVEYYRMDGTVPPEERNNICDSFNNASNTKAKVFLISYKVGGLGLNMVAANRVILMDVNWNPSYETQSIFRIYRFGQVKECFVYRLVSMGTIEEVIYQRSVTKLSIAGRVVDERQITRHYKCAELQEMLRFNVNLEEARPTPKPPSDKLLAKLLLELQTEIFKYHEHQALLENRPDEELNEEEMKLAWDEYHQEQTRENEFKKFELVPLPNANVTNALLDQNRGMEGLTLANSSNVPFMQNRIIDYTGQNPFNVPGDNNKQMGLAVRQNKQPVVYVKIVASQLKKATRTVVTKPQNFRELLLNNRFAKNNTNILPRKDAANPFKPSQINNPALKPFLPSPFEILPSTSSGVVPQLQQLQQLQQSRKIPRDVLVLNGQNYVTEGDKLRSNALEQSGTVVQDDYSSMVNSFKKEYSRIIKKYSTSSDKNTEIMTPRIESVYSEALNNDQTSNLDNEIINLDREDVMKLISSNSSITLLPMVDAQDQSNTDDVIEIP